MTSDDKELSIRKITYGYQIPVAIFMYYHNYGLYTEDATRP